jgi:hypothetical protein
VAFLVFGATVWLATVEGNRLQNLRRTPWLSIVVSVGEPETHQAVVIDGPVATMIAPPKEVLKAWGRGTVHRQAGPTRGLRFARTG